MTHELQVNVLFSCFFSAVHRWRKWCWQFLNTTTGRTSSLEKLYSECACHKRSKEIMLVLLTVNNHCWCIRRRRQTWGESNACVFVPLGLRSMRLHRACPVAAATTALMRSWAGGPNTARPRWDTPTGAGTAGVAATDRPPRPSADWLKASNFHSFVWKLELPAISQTFELEWASRPPLKVNQWWPNGTTPC